MKTHTSPFFHSLKTIWPLATKKDKRGLIGLLALSLGCALSELGLACGVALLAAFFAAPEQALSKIPAFLSPITDFAVQDPRYGVFLALAGVVALIVTKNIFAIFMQWRSTIVAETLSNNIRQNLMQFFTRAPYLWLIRQGTPDLLFAFTASAQMGNVLINIVQMANQMAILFFFCISLFFLAPIPSLILLGVLVLSAQTLVKGVRKHMKDAAADVYKSDYQAHTIQQTGVHALKEMRLYGRGAALNEKYRGGLDAVQGAKSWQSIFIPLPVAVLETLGFMALLGVLGFLVWGQDASLARITGIMGFMAAAAWRLLPVGNRLLGYWSNFCAATPYLEKVAEVLEVKRSMDDSLITLQQDTPFPLDFATRIHFDNVNFQYPESAKAALDKVSFTIPKGTMLGIVGLSGAGKSTLINLLTGLLPPDSGHIVVDDTELSLENTPAWLAKIGYVAQSPYIMNASLAENIALSRWGEDIDRERVMECCRMAAIDFLEQLESSIDTLLGERGTRLSGGQAQRVVIARALYSAPELIIFDEATSSLDMKNEKAIHETILTLRNHATLVIIAHRLSSVEGCENILWLENGKVVQTGESSTVLEAYKARLSLEFEQQTS